MNGLKSCAFDVLVMNTNDNYREAQGNWIPIMGSSSPQEHASTVWDRFITPAKNLGPVAIVAHSYGGVVTLDLAERKTNFSSIVRRVAFTDSVHSFETPSSNMKLLHIFRPVGFVTNGNYVRMSVSSPGDINRFSS